MFPGQVPRDSMAIAGKIIQSWDVKDVYVGCSGNYSIERMLYPMKKFALHSNDVMLYSKCLGDFYSGKPIELELSEWGMENVPWIADYLETDADKIATLMLGTKVAPNIGSKLPYYQRVLNEYKLQWDSLHSKTKASVEASELKIKDFWLGDCIEFVKMAPDDCGYVSYPPFIGGANAYSNRYFKNFEKMFKFEPPEFTLLDPEIIVGYFEQMTKKKKWLFATNRKLEDERFAPYLCGMSKQTNRSATVWTYSNADTCQIVTPNQATVTRYFPRLMPGEDVGNEMTLSVITYDEFQTLRSQYMNKGIRPGAATLSVAVKVDGKLVGVYAFSSSPTLANWDAHIDTPTIYMLSDFPVAPTDYPRLSKLILYAALSKESKRIAEALTKKRVKSIVTTAFSNNPVSMKYRGIFKRLTCKKNDALSKAWAEGLDETNKYYQRPYDLNYGQTIGMWTLQEGLQMWKQKHGQKGTKKEDDA